MYALILVAAVGAPPDPPPLESRVSSLEWRMGAAEYRLRRLEDLARRPEPPPLQRAATAPGQADPVIRYALPQAVPQVVVARRSYVTGQGHTHTCGRCGTTWDHGGHAGHNCPTCGAYQNIQDVPGSTGVSVKTYSYYSRQESVGTCSGPGCSTSGSAAWRPFGIFRR